MWGKRCPRFLLLAVAVSLVALVPTPARALTQTTGTIIAYGELTATGLTSIPVGVVPDPAQWLSWPARGWQLDVNTYPNYSGTCVAYRPPSTHDDNARIPSTCALAVSGSMFGWCEMSKGIGGGGYGSTTGSESASFNSFRWSGAGATLAVTGEMTTSLWPTYLGYTVFGKYGSYARGTFAGTMTLLREASTPPVGCLDPNGLQSSIPVVLELQYALS